MKSQTQRRLLALYMVLIAVFAVAFVTQCSRNWGRTRLVEQFDNGPILPGPDGTARFNPGPSEGYRWVGENDSPPPGKNWKPVDPATLTPEERKRVP